MNKGISQDITRQHTKFLMVSRALPIESGGTMIVLRRLLENFNKDEAFVLGRTSHKSVVLKDVKLNAGLTEIPTPQISGYRLWMMLSVIPGVFLGVRLLRKYRIPVIIGVYPDEGSILLAYLLHKITGKPLMAYFCDLYMENKNKGWQGKIAKWLQPRIFKSAHIISVNKAVQDFYKNRYGKDSLLIQTMINQKFPEPHDLPLPGKKFIIGYSGSIITDRIDPMQDMVKAIGNDPNYELRIFSPQDESYLKSNGLSAGNVTLKFCKSSSELISELEQCNLLYLPLTFKLDKNSYEQISTCFGIKTYEYFLSYRPILVHCPLAYFTSDFFEQNKCGYRIDKISVEEIKLYLCELKKNYDKVAPMYVQNALSAAKKFKGELLASKLRSAVYEIVSDN